jgi:hypothetical protein
VAASLQLRFLSDTCFSRGVGSGLAVDIDVDHDVHGLPVVTGRTVRGLLRDTWLSAAVAFPALDRPAERVLGVDRDDAGTAILRFGDAGLDTTTRAWVAAALGRDGGSLGPHDIRDALSVVRDQTALDRWGAPREHSLRRIRAWRRGLALNAPLSWNDEPTDDELSVLALAALATRHAGLSRTRGLGHLEITIDGDLDETRRLLPASASGVVS